jgi:chromodomain-helicase-DNA-binding protein 1
MFVLQEFSTKNKLLITGTPLQNSVEELWYIPLFVHLLIVFSSIVFCFYSQFILSKFMVVFSHAFSHWMLDRALLHFLDHDKFRSKEEFIERYKNLSSFNEIEVLGCFLVAIQ